jgi:hypothetical protein
VFCERSIVTSFSSNKQWERPPTRLKLLSFLKKREKELLIHKVKVELLVQVDKVVELIERG